MTKKHLWAAALSLLLAAVVLTTGTFAWLSKEQTANQVYAALSDFEVDGTLYFNNTAYVPPTGTGTNPDSILVPVSFSNSDPHYIGNMKYVVKYSGASPAYIRVRVLEQWVDIGKNEIMSVSYLNYALSDKVSLVGKDPVTYPAAGSSDPAAALSEVGAWIDNRAADYCYYYSVPVQPRRINVTEVGAGEEKKISAVGDGTVELTLFDQVGADTEGMIAGIDKTKTQMMLLIEVEAVQPNRFREFFHIDAIPKVKK